MAQKFFGIVGNQITEIIDAYQGTVTSVAALSLGTTGTDLSSTVADGTGAAVITLQVPTASASNRGALSSTDWSTFNGKYTPGTALSATTATVSSSVGTTTSIAVFKNQSAASATNIVRLAFWASNSFGGNEQIAWITALNPNAGANNGGELRIAVSANGTGTTPATAMTIYQSGAVSFSSSIAQTPVAFASLPTGAAGMRAFVNNALAPVFGAAVAGGGAVTIPVFHDGVSWKVG